jgi:hypothetical protein
MKKLLALTFLAATLATGAMSVHAVVIKPKASATCGQTCRVPGISCPKGCFCQISGVDTGVCMNR